MNTTMIDTFNRVHTNNYSILTLDAHVRNGRPIVRTCKSSSIFGYLQNFSTVYPAGRKHLGYQIACQINAELLLLEPEELDLLKKIPRTKRTSYSLKSQLHRRTVAALYLLNATPFIFYAVQRYLPDLHCLFCNNYLPVPTLMNVIDLHPGVTDNYRGPTLFKAVFPELAFCCYNHRDDGTWSSCRNFHVLKTTKIKPLEAAIYYARAMGQPKALSLLSRVQAEVEHVRNRPNPLK